VSACEEDPCQFGLKEDKIKCRRRGVEFGVGGLECALRDRAQFETWVM
jgi:hypothetical protein